MRREELEALERLFAAALEAAPEERRRLLAAAPPELAREAEKLLLADARAGDLAELVAAAAAEVTAEAGPAGRRLGPFELLRELGRGGMSTVYLARRPPGQLPREVALKVVRQGLASPMLERRLLAETRILAGLVHPNIARLLDSGRAEDGSPYFVMEAIDGLPIDQYCDHHRLGVEARLRLFLATCRAVDHAHRNLIVHRDLKPSNVLVDREGAVKLLDFGIAKLLDADQEVELTRSSLRLGTPGYASPEQILGQPITTASDVYSLGVLLYRLLTGSRPYRFGTTAPLREIEAAIVGEKAPPASAAAARAGATVEGIAAAAARGERPESLARRLRGDLDTILAMALRKEPERRYLSAAQLAEDLERHLEGHPVRARRDTFFYRAGKFAGRHRWAVAAGAAALVVSLFFVAALWRQEQRTARERDRAESVSGLLVSLFEVAEPAPQRAGALTARELLDRGRAELSRLEDQPESQLLLRSTLAGLYEKLGLFGEARELLRQNLELQEQRIGRRHAAVAETLYLLGRATARGGDIEAAEPLFRESLELRRQLLGEDDPAVAVGLNSLALVLHEKGELAAAEPLYRQAIEKSRRLLGEADAQTVKTRANLALLLLDRGDYEPAEKLFGEALAGREALPGDQELVAEALDGLGQTLLAQGRAEEAATRLEEGLELRQSLFGDEHPSTARSRAHLGDALRARDPEAAEELIERAREQRRALLGEDSAELAESLAIEAALRASQGREAEAADLYRRSIETYGKTLAEGHPLMLRPIVGLALLEAGRGKCEEAVPLLEAALGKLPLNDRRREAAERAVEGCPRILTPPAPLSGTERGE